MINRIKLIIFIFSNICVQSVFSQISELHIAELANCIPLKNKDSISSIEQSYKNGVVLYNDALSSSLIEPSKIEKLEELFKIQVSTKNKFQEIWEQADSTSRENSRKYFEEASLSFKDLTDTLSKTSPIFKSTSTALVIVEKSHQVILLQKFGLQVLFGCVRESSGRLGQPTDISNNIVINIDMVERFRKVWNDSNFPIAYELWAYSPTERTRFSKKSYADTWNDYSFGTKKDITMPDSLNQNLIAQNAIANLTSSANISQPSIEGIKESGNNQSLFETKGDKSQRIAGSISNQQKDRQSYPIKGEGKHFGINENTQYEIKNLASSEKIKSMGIDFFTIQIAASKNQLVTERLKKEFYFGNLNIEEKNENGWYKYVIGHFSSIDSANNYLASPYLVRGFVSGYNSKGRVAIFSIKQPISVSRSSSSYSMVFRVQIAASKQPLAGGFLSRIYNGQNPINVSQEEGWFKYSIGDFIYYDEAQEAREACGIKGAFVMPYQNGERMQWPSKGALALLKANQKANLIYVVQVAASRTPLSIDIIKSVVKIDYPLTMKFEDGWYKYYISAFTDFAAAKQVAEKVGIKGAFIATYKNGLRVNP